MRAEGQVDYIEIPTTDLVKTSQFFNEFYGWSFQEWGPDYSSFNDGRMDGAFTSSIPRAQNNNNQSEQG